MTEINELFQLSERLLRINHKDFRRYLLSTESAFSSRLSILLGARGVGKTTLIAQYLKKFAHDDITSSKILYLPADHLLLGESNLYEIAERFEALGGELFAIDEIHKYPAWSKTIKSITDTFPNLKLLISGSSILELEKGSHDLSRRAVIYRLKGMSFREFLSLHYQIEFHPLSLNEIIANHKSLATDIISQLTTRGLKILPLFNEYLHYGYFPYYLDFHSSNHYYQTLLQSLQNTIEVDIPAVHATMSGASVYKVKKLMGILATMVPFTPDLKKLRELLELGDERTLKIYLQLLDRAGLITTLSKSGTGMKELRKPEKIYLNNPNLAYALAPRQDGNIGSIREIFFINALQGIHNIKLASAGDFYVDDRILFEIGGRNKTSEQIIHHERAYLALDDMEVGIGQRLPLWLCGFLY